MRELAFRFAGLEILVRSPLAPPIDAVSHRYARYPSDGGSHDVVIEIEPSAEFSETELTASETATLSAEPASGAPPGLRLHRPDVEALVRMPPQGPVHARFITARPGTTETAIRATLAVALPLHRGLILHASGAALGAAPAAPAIALCGESGAGKTSIAANLVAATTGAKLADELLVVRELADGWRAFVAPFYDSEPLPFGKSFPLAAWCGLAPDSTGPPERLEAASAMKAVLGATLTYAAAALPGAALLDTVARLAQAVPCWRLPSRDRVAAAAAALAIGRSGGA